MFTEGNPTSFHICPFGKLVEYVLYLCCSLTIFQSLSSRHFEMLATLISFYRCTHPRFGCCQIGLHGNMPLVLCRSRVWRSCLDTLCFRFGLRIQRACKNQELLNCWIYWGCCRNKLMGAANLFFDRWTSTNLEHRNSHESKIEFWEVTFCIGS